MYYGKYRIDQRPRAVRAACDARRGVGDGRERQAGKCRVLEVVVARGPVGVCLAMLLGNRGISVGVVEEALAIEEDPCASTSIPRHFELLEPFGITKVLIDQGLVCPNWQV